MSKDVKMELNEKEYTYDNFMDYVTTWAESNNMTPSMMYGILLMGINTYESNYTAYTIAMDAWKLSQHKKED